MRSTSVINIRTDAEIKSQAQAIAENLGLNLSTVINAYLRQLIRTQRVSFGLNEEPTDYLLETLRSSRKDIEEGLVSSVFDDAEKADKWLDNPKAKYENKIQPTV